MSLLDNTLFVWILIAAAGLFVLRVVLKVTKKLLTLAIMLSLAVAVYLVFTQYLLSGNAPLP
jgi:RsiW-degrading membrane proteinase PrsW (M82 family)